MDKSEADIRFWSWLLLRSLRTLHNMRPPHLSTCLSERSAVGDSRSPELLTVQALKPRGLSVIHHVWCNLLMRFPMRVLGRGARVKTLHSHLPTLVPFLLLPKMSVLHTDNTDLERRKWSSKRKSYRWVRITDRKLTPGLQSARLTVHCPCKPQCVNHTV